MNSYKPRCDREFQGSIYQRDEYEEAEGSEKGDVHVNIFKIIYGRIRKAIRNQVL